MLYEFMFDYVIWRHLLVHDLPVRLDLSMWTGRENIDIWSKLSMFIPYINSIL